MNFYISSKIYHSRNWFISLVAENKGDRY